MKKYLKREEGQGLLEYGIIIALVAIVSITGLTAFGAGLSDKYQTLSGQLPAEEAAKPALHWLTSEDGVEVNAKQGWLKGDYDNEAAGITIPKLFDGVSIKAIYQDVFRNAGLTEVSFEPGTLLERIHARAFQDNGLTSIQLPEGLQRIDLRAFMNNKLTEVSIPGSVKTIEQNAFDGNNITKVTIGSDVKLGKNVFANDSKGFADAYASGGAGTYVFQDNVWKKI